MARQFGATDTINSTAADPVELLMDLTHGTGVEYSFETTAVAEVAQKALDCLALRGCLTCLSATPQDLSSIIWSERKVIGSFLGSSRLNVDIPHYLDLYRQGRLKLDEMISLEVAPDHFQDAVGAVNDGRAARTVVRFI